MPGWIEHIPPEIMALIDKPLLFAAVLAAGALIGLAVASVGNDMRRRAWRKRNAARWSGTPPRGGEAIPRETGRTTLADAADQLRIVMNAEFSARPLLNRSEARVFRELSGVVARCNPRWQVMAQVSLGEILSSRDEQAYRCINAKRVDLLLMDGECRARHAIEYQGDGHYQGTAAARDAVKKEALRRAGIGYHEVIGGHTTREELRRLVERLLGGVKGEF